jgi:hypothetical protein
MKAMIFLSVASISLSLAACNGGGSKEWNRCVADVGMSIKNPDDY